MATVTLNGTSYTISASNGAAADLTAANALMDQVDAIVRGWQTAYAADGASFYKQGGSAGSLTAGASIGGLQARLQATQNNLLTIAHG
jgi:hypothetical protein